MRYYDNTRLSAYKSCPRKAYFRHVLDLTGEGISAALAFGGAWHAAMDVLWDQADSSLSNEELARAAAVAFEQHWTSEGFPPWHEMDMEEAARLEPRTPAIAAEMIVNYINLRRDWLATKIEVLHIERPFCVPLYPQHPDTPSDEQKVMYVGRLDKMFRLKQDKRVYIAEHKTTSWYRTEAYGGPFAPLWQELFSNNSQIDGYIHAGHMLYGDEFKAVWIDAALVHKKIHDKFKFIPVEKFTSNLDQWLSDTSYWTKAFDSEIDTLNSLQADIKKWTHMPMFPRNTNSCGEYMSRCPYFDLCTSVTNPEQLGEEIPAGMKRSHWEPFAELELKEIGLTPES